MYVCICNGLNQKSVEAAVSEGAPTVSSVYHNCGCTAKCGKCVPVVRDMWRDGQMQAPPAE